MCEYCEGDKWIYDDSELSIGVNVNGILEIHTMCGSCYETANYCLYCGKALKNKVKVENRWTLAEDIKNIYKPVIEKFLKKIEDLTYEEVKNIDGEDISLDLSDTRLNPYTLLELMKELGYSKEEFDSNGWELDFFIDICKSESHPSKCEKLCIQGCGMTFELKLSVDKKDILDYFNKMK